MFGGKQYGFMRKGEAPNVPSLAVDGALTVGGRTTSAGFTSSINGSQSNPAYRLPGANGNGMYHSGVADRWELSAGSTDVYSVRTALAHAYVHFSTASTATIGSTIGFNGKVAHSVSTPSALTGNTDNWNVGSATFLRISSTGIVNLTGILAGDGGEPRYMVNVGTNQINIMHDVTSTAANRFFTSTGANLAMTADDILLAIYDATITRWRCQLL